MEFYLKNILGFFCFLVSKVLFRDKESNGNGEREVNAEGFRVCFFIKNNLFGGWVRSLVFVRGGFSWFGFFWGCLAFFGFCLVVCFLVVCSVRGVVFFGVVGR